MWRARVCGYHIPERKGAGEMANQINRDAERSIKEIMKIRYEYERSERRTIGKHTTPAWELRMHTACVPSMSPAREAAASLRARRGVRGLQTLHSGPIHGGNNASQMKDSLTQELQQKAEETEMLQMELQMVETQRVRMSLVEDKLVEIQQILQQLRDLDVSRKFLWSSLESGSDPQHGSVGLAQLRKALLVL